MKEKSFSGNGRGTEEARGKRVIGREHVPGLWKDQRTPLEEGAGQ